MKQLEAAPDMEEIAAIDDFFEKRKYQKLHDNNIQ